MVMYQAYTSIGRPDDGQCDPNSCGVGMPVVVIFLVTPEAHLRIFAHTPTTRMNCQSCLGRSNKFRDRSKFGKFLRWRMASPTSGRKWGDLPKRDVKKTQRKRSCLPLLKRAKEVYQFWNSHLNFLDYSYSYLAMLYFKGSVVRNRSSRMISP
jgi:hypothetical protein